MTDSRSATRTAITRTTVADAEILAASVRPDNTPQIDTRVEEAESGGVVVTTVERETTGGLRTTIDDYVVNLTVAQETAQIANRHANRAQSSADANADDSDQTQS